MGLKLEGGKDWMYVLGAEWQLLSDAPKEILEGSFFLSPDRRSYETVGVYTDEGLRVEIYGRNTAQHIPIEVEELGGVEPDPEACPTLCYRLNGPHQGLSLSFGEGERLIIMNDCNAKGENGLKQ